MPPSRRDDFKRLVRLIGAGNERSDILALLELVRDRAANAALAIPGVKPEEDSLTVRRAVHSILQDAIDNIRRVSKAEHDKKSEEAESDEYI